MGKYKLNCIIHQKIEIDAELLAAALEKADIVEVENTIMERGADNYTFIPEAVQYLQRRS
jgi:hypothetical protein